MRRLILFLAIMLAGSVAWLIEHAEGRSLRAQLQALASANADLAIAQREQQRLRAALPADADVQALRTSAAAAKALRDEQAAASARPTPGLAASAVGEWSSPANWGERGSSAPRATLETALWAAAGGDTARLAQLLELSDDVRARATAILANLPPSERAKYPTPEALIAAFTIKRIPVGPAQIVWAQESDPDQATLCVFVRDPAVPRPVISPDPNFVEAPRLYPPMTREEAMAKAVAEAERRKAERARPDYRPPQLTPGQQPHTTMAYLSLHRADDGWRLQVPLTAVDRIASELTPRPAAPPPL